jgi:hypothetical protein
MIDVQNLVIQDVTVSEDTLTVDLSDGRSVSVPVGWYLRLWHGNESERNHWQLIGRGVGIHWSELDEDISLAGLLQGKPSNESPKSLERWLRERAEQ